MKANELSSRDLMVGDWLMHANGTPMQVKRIVLGHFACGEKYTNFWEYNNKFQPIPLTPEILDKNGFERDKNISLYNAYTGINSRVTLHDDFMSMNSRNMWYVHVDSEDYSTIAGCELTYVHELQHILRLCKIGKEIVV